MAELSPSNTGVADATRTCDSACDIQRTERTNGRTTDVSDDRGIPELSDVRARVQDFNKVDGQAHCLACPFAACTGCNYQPKGHAA